jgi:hypothetical protein
MSADKKKARPRIVLKVECVVEAPSLATSRVPLGLLGHSGMNTDSAWTFYSAPARHRLVYLNVGCTC